VVIQTTTRNVQTSIAKLIERCSDGGEDQGAEEALWGNGESFFVSFGSRLPCERLSFQSVVEGEFHAETSFATHERF